jgi:hypothetical protein
LTLSRQERRDLFQPEPVTVLAVEVQKPGLLPGLFQRTAAAFPDLTYYDADLPLSARHAAVYGTFPLAKLQVGVTVSVDGITTVQNLQVLDSPWDLDPWPPPLRVMRLSPDCDPRRGTPAWLEVSVLAPAGFPPAAESALSAVEGRLSAAEGALNVRTSSAIEGRREAAKRPAGFDGTQPAWEGRCRRAALEKCIAYHAIRSSIEPGWPGCKSVEGRGRGQ